MSDHLLEVVGRKRMNELLDSGLGLLLRLFENPGSTDRVVLFIDLILLFQRGFDGPLGCPGVVLLVDVADQFSAWHFEGNPTLIGDLPVPIPFLKVPSLYAAGGVEAEVRFPTRYACLIQTALHVGQMSAF